MSYRILGLVGFFAYQDVLFGRVFNRPGLAAVFAAGQ
jgi:hypothetical protein